MKKRKFTRRAQSEKRNTKKITPWKRVKTVCLIVLLLCNIVLLAVSAAGKVSDMVIASQTRKNLDGMLAQNGMLCGSSVYKTLQDPPQAYALRMDSSTQKTFAKTLLGERAISQPDKGNSTSWTAENGTLTWTAAGDVTASFTLLDQTAPTSIDEAADVIETLFRQAGIELEEDQLSSSQPDAGQYMVTVKQEIDGIELLGCSLTFVMEGNAVEVNGTWCTGDAQPTQLRALESYSAQRVMFWLIAADTGMVQIISAQPVYVLSDKSGGRFTAIPCWRFSADNGDFVLNILTGDVVASTDLNVDFNAETEIDTADDDTVQP